jgi:hypothetical protein
MQTSDSYSLFQCGKISFAHPLSAGLQDTPHDFPTSCLRKRGNEADRFRFCNRSNFVRHVLLEFVGKPLVSFDPRFEYDVSVDRDPFDLVRQTDYSGFCDRGMADQCRFQLGRSEPVSTYFDYIVDASDNPVVTVFILPRRVSCEVDTGIFAPAGFSHTDRGLCRWYATWVTRCYVRRLLIESENEDDSRGPSTWP